MAKEKITRAEYLQLLGLGLMAKQHYDQIIAVRDAMHALLGTSEDSDLGGPDGWVGDTVWGGENNIDYMLKMMKIQVAESVDANS